MFNIFKIEGDSMAPHLIMGDYVLTTRLKRLALGSLVVVSHPMYKVLVKRVIDINDIGEFLLSGENSASISTEKMGWFKPKQLLGIVLWRCHR